MGLGDGEACGFTPELPIHVTVPSEARGVPLVITPESLGRGRVSLWPTHLESGR